MAGCGYVCPQCEGVGFTADLQPCNWCNLNNETMITIYHNSRCSKSRNALRILEEKGVKYTIVNYLATPFTPTDLEALIAKLGIKPIELIRKGEAVYKEKYSHKNVSDAEWIQAMVEHPILIERPIVVNGNKAVVARPPEKVLTIL